MNIERIPESQVSHVWPLIEANIERALHEGLDTYATKDVLQAAQEGYMQIWVAGSVAAVVTLIVEYPKHKALIAAFCGGSDGPSWWEDMDLTLEQFARDNGCEEVRIIGRGRAWVRVLKGYEEVATIARKRVWAVQ